MSLVYSVRFFLGALIILGSFLSVSSFSWLSVWLGLEINLMCFIPLLVFNGGVQGVESSMKYFVVQAVGSGVLLLGAVSFFQLGNFSFFLLVVGLMIKLGLAPFHWWIPAVMGGVDWVPCFVLGTWQKLAPLFLLVSLSFSFSFFSAFLVVCGCLSALVGGVGGVNQVQLRYLLGFSSIGHLGWMVCLGVFSFLGVFIYFLVYVTISFFIFGFLSGVKIFRFSQVGGLSSGFWGFLFVLGLVSLGGFPPLSGFFSKWLSLQVLVCSSGLWLPFFLLCCSFLSLFYYLNTGFVFFLFLVKGEYTVKWNWQLLSVFLVFAFFFSCFLFPVLEGVLFALSGVSLGGGAFL